MRKKRQTYGLSIIVAFLLFIAMIVVGYQAGLSADESHFGSSWWHYLAWIAPILFLMSLAWVGFEYKRSKNMT